MQAAVVCEASAAEPTVQDRAEIRRAVLAVGLSSSEEPAVRQERRSREPSAAFLLGAALAAWIQAREQLEFDLTNPAAAGAPHASQGPANEDAIAEDCAEEMQAFAHLDARASALGLTVEQVTAAAALQNRDALAIAWQARRAGADRACR